MFLPILVLTRLILAHAVLNYPPPFNPNPSKTSPCGGGDFAVGVSPILNLTSGADLPIYWQVIAGDGSGTVTASVLFNSTSKDTGFSLEANSVGKFQKNMTVPNERCSNSSNPCIMHVQTSSNWYSCFAFTVDNFDPAKPKGAQCQAVSNLNFCPSLNNQRATLPPSNSYALEDAIEQNFYNSIIGNKNVISNGTVVECQQRLQAYLCLSSMPFCGTSASLTTSTVGMNECYCEKMKDICGVTASHSALFDCTQLVRCDKTTNFGISNKWSAWWVILLLLV